MRRTRSEPEGAAKEVVFAGDGVLEDREGVAIADEVLDDNESCWLIVSRLGNVWPCR